MLMLEHGPKKHGAEEAILDMCQVWRDLAPLSCQLASPLVFVGGSFLTWKKKEENGPITYDSLELHFESVKWNSFMKKRFSTAQQIGRLLRRAIRFLEQERNQSLLFPGWEFSFSRLWSTGCWQSHEFHHWGVKHKRLYSMSEMSPVDAATFFY